MAVKPTVEPARKPAAKRRSGTVVAVTLGSVLLVLAAAYVALRHTYPPARLAAMLAEQVSTATGRDFRIDGDLSIRVLPTLAIEARDIVLANAAWGSPTDMVRARRVAFRLSLRDLLGGRLRILSIDVEGADLWLEADGTGRFNWQLDGPKKSTSGGATLIALDRVVASDSRVTYRDGEWSTARTVTIDSLDLAAQGDGQHLNADFEFNQQRWKVDGEIGRLAALLAGSADWPFDLRFDTPGGSASVQGALGTGARAGIVDAKVTARVDAAAALAAYIPAASELPLPIEWKATLHRTPGELRADPMQLGIAGQTLSGRVTRLAGESQPRIEAQLSAAAIDLSKWRAVKPARSAPTAPTQRDSLFSDTPLPFDALPAFPLKIALDIQSLVVPGLPPLSSLKAQITSGRGRIVIDPLTFTAAGGQVRGRLDVASRKDAPPRTEIQLNASSLSVETLDAQWGRRHFEGGRADLDARLAMVGRTTRALAASSTGEVLLAIHDVGLAGKAATLDRDLVARLFDALIPSSAAHQNLVLQCAVVRLPLRSGVAAIDRSIAFETQQIAVSAGGVINLDKQTMALAFQPRVKKGLPLNPSSLAELMLLEGPLAAPQLSINPQGIARQAANFGVAAATGGLSLLGPVLRRESGEASACARAMQSGPGAQPARAAPAVPATPATERHKLLPRPFASPQRR